MDAGQVVTGGDWALVLLTTKLAATSLLSSENFVQIGPSIQVVNDFPKHTNVSPLYHIPFMPCFFFLFANSVSFRITSITYLLPVIIM